MKKFAEVINSARQMLIDSLTAHVRENGGKVECSEINGYIKAQDETEYIECYTFQYMELKGDSLLVGYRYQCLGREDSYEEGIENFSFDEIVAIIDRMKN